MVKHRTEMIHSSSGQRALEGKMLKMTQIFSLRHCVSALMPVPQLTLMTSWQYAMGLGCHVGKIQKCVAVTLQSHSRLSPKGGSKTKSFLGPSFGCYTWLSGRFGREVVWSKHNLYLWHCGYIHGSTVIEKWSGQRVRDKGLHVHSRLPQ